MPRRPAPTADGATPRAMLRAAAASAALAGAGAAPNGTTFSCVRWQCVETATGVTKDECAARCPAQKLPPQPEAPQQFEPEQTDWCQPTECFERECKPGCCLDVQLTPFTLNVSAWDRRNKRYQQVGTAASHFWIDANTDQPYSGDAMEIGVFAHGPLMDNDAVAAPCTLDGCPDEQPPTYFSATVTDKVFVVDSVNKSSGPDGAWAAKAKLVAWTDAPSVQYNVRDKKGADGKVVAMLVADGAPTAPVQGQPGPQGQIDMSRGGVTAVYKDKAIKIFPGPNVGAEYQVAGRVVNTVQCHEASGFCWFSAWKFYGAKADWDPDCLWWCVLDDFAAPTECVVGGVVEDAKGQKVCHNNDTGDNGGPDGTTIGGGVHGFGKGRERNLNKAGTRALVDLFLVYTGGSDFTQGVSWIRKLDLYVDRKSGKDAVYKVVGDKPWGSDLWEDTVANHTNADVGCDHAWMDLSEQNVWVTTFRQPNDGIHRLDYDSGRLIHSYHGMAKQRVPNPGGPYYYANYSYSAGLSGRGVAEKPNSIVTFATSENLPTRYAANPGRGSLWWADVSKHYPSFGDDGVLH